MQLRLSYKLYNATDPVVTTTSMVSNHHKRHTYVRGLAVSSSLPGILAWQLEAYFYWFFNSTLKMKAACSSDDTSGYF
jgi:hypothetical protein